MTARFVSDSERRSAVPMAYRLFSQQNSTGRSHSAARLSDSWNSPSAMAPSPKKQATSCPVPSFFAASASPTATGRPPADDGVAAVEVVCSAEEVHRAAAAVAAAFDLAEHLRHDLRGRDTASQGMTMLPVGGDNRIVGAQARP